MNCLSRTSIDAFLQVPQYALMGVSASNSKSVRMQERKIRARFRINRQGVFSSPAYAGFFAQTRSNTGPESTKARAAMSPY